MKSNDNRTNSRVILPLPPTEEGTDMEMDIYVRFMRHLRMSHHGRTEVKILSSIQFVADMTASSEAHVTKVLVDLGLRTPRFALPAEYLEFADVSLTREDRTPGCATNHLKDLNAHWASIGEDPFAGAKRQYVLRDMSNLQETV